MSTNSREWLISARKEQGYSQKAFSEKIGISQPSYCNIEAGKSNPKVQTAKNIATILALDWTEFYEDTRKNDTGPAA